MSVLANFQRCVTNAFQKAYPNTECATKVIFNKSNKDHYTWAGAMPLAKVLNIAATEIVNKVLANLEIPGAAFYEARNIIYMRPTPEALEHDLDRMHKDKERLGIPVTPNRRRTIVEYSSPNIAKELHVGHLRSTIIGESLARLLEFVGHDVLRLSHIGDWGTQFGMLLHYFETQKVDPKGMNLGELLVCYKNAKKLFDMDPDFKEKSRLAVVSLQSGEPKSRAIWEGICDVSRRGYQEIYKLLDITVKERGESYYNDMLDGIVEDLEKRKIATVNEGALCIFVPEKEEDRIKREKGHAERVQKRAEEVKKKGGETEAERIEWEEEEEERMENESNPPFMLRKSDGGYGYDSTDIAAMKQRVETEKSQHIIVIVDSGQSLHFKTLEKVSVMAGYLDPQKTKFEHVGFGLVKGNDGKKFKTRSGEVALLKDLIYDALEKARVVCADKEKDRKLKNAASSSKGAAEEESIYNEQTAITLGVGALKYADLKNPRQNDYVFNTEKMLSFEGDTVVYLLYALVRIRTIFRQAGKEAGTGPFSLKDPTEQALAFHLRRFEEVIEIMEETLEPHHMCGYIYELSTRFNAFYKSCKVIGSPEEEARLRLCDLTGRVQTKGLELLGISTLDRM